jgi:F0F1-type ATP synthase assembly protein I
MAVQGEAKTPEEKRFMFAYAGAFVGVIIGAFLGAILFGHRMASVPGATILGAIVGGAIGFCAPGLAVVWRDFLGHKRT